MQENEQENIKNKSDHFALFCTLKSIQKQVLSPVQRHIKITP